jgi:hypothetical protein
MLIRDFVSIHSIAMAFAFASGVKPARETLAQKRGKSPVAPFPLPLRESCP